MSASALWEISVVTAFAAEEPVAALLEKIYGTPASIYQQAERNQSRVAVYLSKAERAADRLRLQAGLISLRDLGLATAPGSIRIKRLARRNWAESWKHHFPPIEIGGRLLILPDWSKRRARPNQITVRLNPGLSFGTGQHHTTRFCLEQIAACRSPQGGQSFLDIGTGSGILAVAAARLGYRPVRAIDLDPIAIRVARQNASRNGVSREITFSREDFMACRARSAVKYSLICANLTADLLENQGGRIVNRLKLDGRLDLSGVLRTEFARIESVYRGLGLRLLAKRAEKEWQSGLFSR